MLSRSWRIKRRFAQDLIALFQPCIQPDNLRPLALLLELLTVIPEEFSTLLLPSQRRAQVSQERRLSCHGFETFLIGKETL